MATQALGECVGALLEHGGTHPDVVWLFTTPPHVGVLEDVQAALRRLLSPRVLLGAVADTVVGGGREIEGQPAMSLLALWSRGPGDADRSAPIPLRLRPWRQGPDPADLEQLRGASGTVCLLVDRPSLAPELLLDALAEVAPELKVVGAAVDPPAGRHANVLVETDALHGDGAVGVLLPSEQAHRLVLSQGVRTMGEPVAVTRAERNVVLELGGRPAGHHLDVALAALAQGDDPAAELLLAEVVETGAEDDELLVHRLVGRDPDRGAVVLDAEVDVGSLVLFARSDAASADADLTLRLSTGAAGAAGALCVLGTGRGWPLFGTPDHDALAVSELLPGAALAGLVAPAPFASVGARHQIAPRSVAILLTG